MGIFGRLLGIPSFSPAGNALLAEHVIGCMDHDDREAVKEAITVMAAGAGFPSVVEDNFFGMLNRKPRTVQLNLVALALDSAGIEPCDYDRRLAGEFWHTVRNPFRDAANISDSELWAVAKRIQKQRGVSIRIKPAPMDFFSVSSW